MAGTCDTSEEVVTVDKSSTCSAHDLLVSLVQDMSRKLDKYHGDVVALAETREQKCRDRRTQITTRLEAIGGNRQQWIGAGKLFALFCTLVSVLAGISKLAGWI